MSPRTGSFSSAARRPPVWTQPLLYAAEVALKLQASSTSTGGFSQVRFGEAESVPVLGVALLRGISTRAAVSTTCIFTSCALTTCHRGVSAGISGSSRGVSAGKAFFK